MSALASGTRTVRQHAPVGALAAFAVVGVAGVVIPMVVSSQLALTLMTQAVITAVLATGIGFLIRQCGLTSFGHAAFYGLAAYIVALNGKYDLLPTELAIVAAIVLPAAFAFVAGLGIVRLPALAFSMLTLAVVQAFYEIFLSWRELANGDDGMAVRLPSRLFGIDIATFQQPGSMFVVCWLVLIVIVAGLWLIARSPFGLLTVAIRENEERTRFIGYETVVPRALTYAVSAAVAAVAGVLFVLYNAYVTPGTLHWSLSGEGIVMAVIGGAHAVWGPALGSVIFFLLKDAAGDLTEHWPAIIGITLIVVTVMVPRGISGLIMTLLGKMKGARR